MKKLLAMITAAALLGGCASDGNMGLLGGLGGGFGSGGGQEVFHLHVHIMGTPV